MHAAETLKPCAQLSAISCTLFALGNLICWCSVMICGFRIMLWGIFVSSLYILLFWYSEASWDFYKYILCMVHKCRKICKGFLVILMTLFLCFQWRYIVLLVKLNIFSLTLYKRKTYSITFGLYFVHYVSILKDGVYCRHGYHDGFLAFCLVCVAFSLPYVMQVYQRRAWPHR